MIMTHWRTWLVLTGIVVVMGSGPALGRAQTPTGESAPTAGKAAKKPAARKSTGKSAARPVEPPFSARPDEAITLGVAIRFARHPLLTPLLKQDARDELHHELVNYLGPLAEVVVRDGWPLINATAPAALDAIAVGDLPTDHPWLLFDVRYRRNQFHIAAVAWEPGPRWLSEIVTPTPVDDRQFLARTLALTAGDLFTPLGRLTLIESANSAKATFRGAGLLEKFDERFLKERWFRAWSRHPRIGPPGYVPHVYLQVKQRAGHEHELLLLANVASLNELRTAREVALTPFPTLAGPLRVLVREKRAPGTPIGSARVLVAERLSESPSFQFLGVTDATGYFESPRTFAGMCWVKIQHGGKDYPRPVAIGPRFDVARWELSVDQQAGVVSKLLEQLRVARAFIVDLRQQADFQKEDFNKRGDDAAQLGAIIQEAKALETRLQRGVEDSTHEVNGLRKQTEQTAVALPNTFKELDDLLHSLRQDADRLKTYIAHVEKQKASNDLRDRARTAVGEGQGFDQKFEFDKAIRRYEDALRDDPNLTEIRARLNLLKEFWETKSDTHRAAREFFLGDWNSLSGDISSHVSEIERRLNAVFEAKDPLTFLMFTKGVSKFQADLEAFVASLENDGDGGADVLPDLQKASERLGQLTTKGQEALAAEIKRLAGATP